MRRLFSVTQYQYVIMVAQAARERDAALGTSGSAYSQAVAEATRKRDSLDNEAGRSVIQAKNAVTEAENATDIEESQERLTRFPMRKKLSSRARKIWMRPTKPSTQSFRSRKKRLMKGLNRLQMKLLTG